MKIKQLFFIFGLFLSFGLTNVYASSINYNLQIDRDMNFHERIIYNIDSKDIKRDGNYHFLTAILDKPVYFDLQEDIRYRKSKSTTSSGYAVTLQNDYPYMFLSKSRILNECFTKKQINNTPSYISLSASEFYCSHRADQIKVIINTPLNVLSSNASSNNGNTYIWDNVSDSFSLSFKVQTPTVEDDPMDHSNVDVEEEDTANDTNNQIKEKRNTSFIIISLVIAILFISLLFGVIVLKKKKDSLDKF